MEKTRENLELFAEAWKLHLLNYLDSFDVDGAVVALADHTCQCPIANACRMVFGIEEPSIDTIYVAEGLINFGSTGRHVVFLPDSAIEFIQTVDKFGHKYQLTKREVLDALGL